MTKTNSTTINQTELSHLRHELRTPVNAIIGYSEMLTEDLREEEESSSSSVDKLSQIQQQGNELLVKINNILEPITIHLDYDALDSQNILDTYNALNEIIKNCQSLLKEIEADDYQQDINKIQTSAHNLQHLLENLLGHCLKPESVSSGMTAVTSSESKSGSESPVMVEYTTNFVPVSAKVSSSVVRTGNILVVDDNENNRDILTRQLQREGYKVATASGGIPALQMVAHNNYDLILLDLMMPDFNGYQVLQRLKEDSQWQKIPVIMISALDEVDNVVQCIEIGADDYIPKPFNSILLKAKIGASLEKKRLRDQEQQYLHQMEEYSQKLNEEIAIGRKTQQQQSGKPEPISLMVSTQEIRFKAGFTTPTLEVTVTNHSDQFASFILEVIPAGVTEASNFYRLSPEVSTKTPPGADSKFLLTIVSNPEPGFTGMMNLTIQAFCLELNSETREIVRLIIEPGLDLPALQLQLGETNLQSYPESQLIIALKAYNPNKTPVEARFNLQGLSFDWFEEEWHKKIVLPPKKWTSLQWVANLPELPRAMAGVYDFTIQGYYENAPEAIVRSNVEVLATGQTNLSCEMNRYRLPEKKAWFPSWFSPRVNYHLEVENQSNLRQQINLEIKQDEENPCQVELNPRSDSLSPTQKASFDLQVQSKRPILGWGKEKTLDVEVVLSDNSIEDNYPRTRLYLKLLPVIPRWLQTTIGLLLLTGVIWWLELPSNLFNSDNRIYSVRFNGVSDEVMAGSSEGLIYQWTRRGNQLHNRKILAQTDKPIRTLRYRPLNNDKLATGLENGEILIWDLLKQEKQPEYNFTFLKDDRVLSLEYTLDSRHLFSAHGSGLVLQWYVGDATLFALNRNEPTLKRQFDYAISDLALLGEKRNTLAVAGRFNQLQLWNFDQDRVTSLPYQEGGGGDYINSITSPAQKPFQLAIADNQGNVSVWDVNSCLRGENQCQTIDSWQHSTNRVSVNSIAFSDNGCYLASAANNGEIKLWFLGLNGQRLIRYNQGITLASDQTKVNSIDLEIIDDKIFIATGEDHGKVNLYQHRADNNDCS